MMQDMTQHMFLPTRSALSSPPFPAIMKKKVMSRIFMRYVTHVHPPCHITHRMSHVTRMHAPFHTYEYVMQQTCCVMSTVCTSQVAPIQRVMSHIVTSHVTHINETCHTYSTSHVTSINTSCHTYLTSHVTNINESWHTYSPVKHINKSVT